MTTAERRKAFPERVALVNMIARNAFEMRFSKEEPLSNSGKLILNGEKEDVNAFGLRTESNVCDAILLVRPYLRVIEGSGPLEGKMTFVVEGEAVVNREHIEKYLVKDMKDPALDIPVKWPPKDCLFYGAAVTPEGVDPGKGTYGIFAPNGSVIEVRLSDVWCPGPVRAEVGCVAATYTTRGTKGYPLGLVGE